MTTSGIGISVIIPAHNAEETIAKCLSAMKEQELRPLEVIVVNDASSDRTASIAESYGATVISNHRARGAGGARNSGADIAKGEILAFTDSDCVPPPDWLRNISDAFQEDRVVAVAGGYSRSETNGFIARFAFLELRLRRKNSPDYVQTAASNNFAVWRHMYHEAGGFPEIFEGATLEDMILSYHLARMGRIRWLRNNGIGHHFHGKIKRYLRQQYAFGRDTVITYARFPHLLKKRTHQGRFIYIETIITALTMAGALLFWPMLFVGLFAIWALNHKLIMACRAEGGTQSGLKALLFLPVRDVVWVTSVTAGSLKILRMWLSGSDRHECPNSKYNAAKH